MPYSGSLKIADHTLKQDLGTRDQCKVLLNKQAQQRITAAEQAAYAKAGSVAEEVLASVRTVFAFSGEKKECAR